MAGIYIHIPFCKKACHYCNFHFSTSLGLKNDFLNALLKEMELQKSYLADETVKSIYLGGGTPSLLESNECFAILEQLKNTYDISGDAEITLEANPDDLNDIKLRHWKESGINRLSIGVQSFFEEDLTWMNRAHTATQSHHNLAIAKKYFDNITIDLIYGTPTLTDKKWEENINRAIQLEIPHLSCYALTVEPKTVLHTLIEKNKIANIDAGDQARQFLILMELMVRNGYEHYEISNFALPGKRSRHNSSYWQGASYLGLGPSAHSFNKKSRQWNVSNNALYIQSLQKNQLPFELEILTTIQQMNEYVMTSLRTREGIDLMYVFNQFGDKERLRLEHSAKTFIDRELVCQKENNLVLTTNGKLFADGIAADLFGEY